MSLKEKDIRPKGILEEYLRLAREELEHFFPPDQRESNACPACGTRGNSAFEKDGFIYEECPNCQTLYVNPRPPASLFSKFYRESKAAAYWATHFYPKTEASRREKLWRPKARMLADLIKNHQAEHHKIIDIGGGYGVFAEEYTNVSGRSVTVVEPSPHLAKHCRKKGINTIEAFLEDLKEEMLPRGPRIFTSFELFEHLHSPEIFLRKLFLLMNEGDLLIFSTLSGTGVDIRLLWEKSQTVSPPHHLNFLNPRSVSLLLKRCGLQTLRVTTPGKLDLDILRNNLDSISDRFWKTFLSLATDESISAMQETVSACGFSSHMLVVAGKPLSTTEF